MTRDFDKHKPRKWTQLFSRQQNEPMYLLSLAPLFSLVPLFSSHSFATLSPPVLCLGFIAFVYQNCLLQIVGSSSRLLPKEILAYSMEPTICTENPCHGTTTKLHLWIPCSFLETCLYPAHSTINLLQ
jgi:hypothetical protein